MRAEAPATEDGVASILDPQTVDLLAAGNQQFVIELKKHGTLRYQFPRDRLCIYPHAIPINLENMHHGALRTIRGTLTQLHKSKMIMSDAQFYARVEDVSNSLASGCNLVTYMKLRALALTDDSSRHTPDCLRRPRGITDIPIPTAFASAIQQLGIVNIGDLTQEVKVIPCKSHTGFRFGQIAGVTWNPNAYEYAVEFARNLGMQFSIVDTSVKQGTAWWLFQQSYAEGVFQLTCPFPESNFTEEMVMAHALYLNLEDSDPSNALTTLETFPALAPTGIMMQLLQPEEN